MSVDAEGAFRSDESTVGKSDVTARTWTRWEEREEKVKGNTASAEPPFSNRNESSQTLWSQGGKSTDTTWVIWVDGKIKGEKEKQRRQICEADWGMKGPGRVEGKRG